jgi:hypothetical protein
MNKISLAINVNRTQKHPFHIVDASPLPLITACGAFCTVFGFTLYIHLYNYGLFVFFFGLFLLLATMSY